MYKFSGIGFSLGLLINTDSFGNEIWNKNCNSDLTTAGVISVASTNNGRYAIIMQSDIPNSADSEIH